jgi:hypothetical protein
VLSYQEEALLIFQTSLKGELLMVAILLILILQELRLKQIFPMIP